MKNYSESRLITFEWKRRMNISWGSLNGFDNFPLFQSFHFLNSHFSVLHPPILPSTTDYVDMNDMWSIIHQINSSNEVLCCCSVRGATINKLWQLTWTQTLVCYSAEIARHKSKKHRHSLHKVNWISRFSSLRGKIKFAKWQ